MARRVGLTRVRVLDIACGGGDVAVGVACAARRQGLHVELVLVDVSATALQLAAAAAEHAGVPRQTLQINVLEALPAPEVEVVMSSLFLHHLPTRTDVVGLLRQMQAAAGRLVLVSDLRRSRAGRAVAWVGCRALSRSPIVHGDGPASVRAAWTVGELRALAREAGLAGAEVTACWPWRMRLRWEREGGNGR
jgi:2-polyprenyl-3-methyl-5-hydroxy-6-metoxy-1,4-benzoquinol methylase